MRGESYPKAGRARKPTKVGRWAHKPLIMQKI